MSRKQGIDPDFWLPSGTKPGADATPRFQNATAGALLDTGMHGSFI